ncbi:MAG TPA: UvrB/UvrC motif-containing protein [Chthoniobacteraceae bacterium]|jgi:protein arginine kinase activator|nr:UvrB/UvrC motif-containing protein [Chthoniobacteraceae bacterium]
MICDVCKTNEASVFLTQIVEGKMQKVNLCESCSKAKGVDDPTGFALADLLLGLGAAQEIERGSGASHRCAACGFSQADFKKTGRLGCAQCYETFSEGLTSLLKAMHKGTHHTGKVPARISRKLERETTLKTLQRDLQKAVADENYESAAQIRDQLRQLETSHET